VRLLDLTLPTPAENLALDELLLERVEREEAAGEVLRLWESPRAMVVVGRATAVADEVRLPECRRRKIPVLRRISGGASIVAGPGCLMYAVVLSYARFPQLRAVDRAHRFVLQRMAAAVGSLLDADVVPCGTSDLAVGDRKFSGNSLRCRRHGLLYHGTLLYDFPLSLIGECLKSPPRQPDYRCGRRHEQFVTNLHLTADRLRAAIVDTWQAEAPYGDWPTDQVEELVAEKYATEAWNFQR